MLTQAEPRRHISSPQLEREHRSLRPSHRSSTAKGGSFWVLVILIAILCLTGVVMVLSASSIVSLNQFGSPWYFFGHGRMMWLTVGIDRIPAFGHASRPPVRWRRFGRAWNVRGPWGCSSPSWSPVSE